MDDAYALLGLTRGCSMREIKRAYRGKIREIHPDAGRERDQKAAHRAMIAVIEAYGTILADLSRPTEPPSVARDDEYHHYRRESTSFRTYTPRGGAA